MKMKEFFDQIFIANLKDNSKPSNVNPSFSKSDMLDIYRAYAERYNPDDYVSKSILNGFSMDFDLPEVYLCGK